MSVKTSVVPRLTYADKLALLVWNQLNAAARMSYRRDPFAATRLDTVPCSRCRHGQHAACTGRAAHDGYVMCECWLDDHGAAT